MKKAGTSAARVFTVSTAWSLPKRNGGRQAHADGLLRFQCVQAFRPAHTADLKVRTTSRLKRHIQIETRYFGFRLLCRSLWICRLV